MGNSLTDEDDAALDGIEDHPFSKAFVRGRQLPFVGILIESSDTFVYEGSRVIIFSKIRPIKAYVGQLLDP